jgi:hypothetical protein
MTKEIEQTTAIAGTPAFPSPAFPGFKHYVRVNDKSEVIELWSGGITPGRVPDEHDILLRDDGATPGPYIFTPDTYEPLFEYANDGPVYRYKISDGAVAAKTPEEIADEAEAVRLAALPNKVRSQRNMLLDAADKMLFDWRPMAEEKRQEWREYMQELRDLTDQPGFPESVVWPEKPE